MRYLNKININLHNMYMHEVFPSLSISWGSYRRFSLLGTGPLIFAFMCDRQGIRIAHCILEERH